MNMKNTKKLLVIAAILAVVLVACKKNNTTTSNPPIYNSSSVVFDSNQVALQSKGWNLGDSSHISNDSSVIFSGGTQIIFKDSSFVYYMNQMNTMDDGTLGNGTIYIKELYKNSDWIFSNMQTVDSGGRWLQSFGALSIAVYQAGDTLDLDTITSFVPSSGDWRQRFQFRVKVPVTNGNLNRNAYWPSTNQMLVYRNDLDSMNTPSNLLTYPGLNWWTVPVPTDSFNFIYPPTSNQNQFYTFRIMDSLSIYRWYNLADSNAYIAGVGNSGLYNGQHPGTGKITLQNATSPSYADVQAFFVADAPWKVTVIKAVPVLGPNNQNTQYVFNNVPLNITGKIVAWNVSSGKQLYANYLTDNQGNNYFPEVSATSTVQSVTFTITYQQTTLTTLTAAIKALN
jgi:hypothetical protein